MENVIEITQKDNEIYIHIPEDIENNAEYIESIFNNAVNNKCKVIAYYMNDDIVINLYDIQLSKKKLKKLIKKIKKLLKSIYNNAEITEIKEKEKKESENKHEYEYSEWDSELNIIEAKSEDIKIIIPHQLLLVCQYLSEKFSDTEFSILTSIKEIREQNNKVEIYISEDYYIPQQTVTHSHVTVKENIDTNKYNVIIHKHPDNLTSFSTTDKEYINSHYAVSLLFVNNNFHVATYKQQVSNNTIMQIYTNNISVQSPEITIPEDILNKIQKETYNYNYSNKNSKYYNYNRNYYYNYGYYY